MQPLNTEYLPEIWEDQEMYEQERLAQMLDDLNLDYDSYDIIHEFGLGFVEEHGVNIGKMVGFCLDPTNQDSWVFGF
jgi:hypothetical protein